MNQLSEEFIPIITELTKALGALTRLEETKAETASLGYHSRMDGLLKEEQAIVLRIRGLEQRRLKLQENLGWAGFSFRQILSNSDQEQAGLLTPLFLPLEQQIKNLLDVRDSAQRIISLRLREFSTALSQEDGQSYNENGEPGIRIPSHFRDTYV